MNQEEITKYIEWAGSRPEEFYRDVVYFLKNVNDILLTEQLEYEFTYQSYQNESEFKLSFNHWDINISFIIDRYLYEKFNDKYYKLNFYQTTKEHNELDFTCQDLDIIINIFNNHDKLFLIFGNGVLSFTPEYLQSAIAWNINDDNS